MSGSINRRSFFALGAAASAASLFAAGAEEGATPAKRRISFGGPLAEADSPLLKKIKFTPLKIEVGAKTPFKVVHCSDTHLNFMSLSDMLGSFSRQHLSLYDHRYTKTFSLPQFAACILKARLLKCPMIHTGDVWDFDSDLNMELADEAFRLAGDVFYAIGNHEIKGWARRPDATMPGGRARVQPYLPNSVVCAARVINGVNFVSFDDTGYSFDLQKEMVDFVRAEFAKGLPVVMVVHEPFFTQELLDRLVAASVPHKPIDPKNCSGYMYGTRPHEKKFVAWMLAQPNLKAVLCGHLHFEGRYRLSDTVTQYIAGAAKNGNAYEISFS